MKNKVFSYILLPFQKEYWSKGHVIKTLLILFSIKALLYQPHMPIMLGLLAIFGLDMYINKDKDLIVKQFNSKMAEVTKQLASLKSRDSLSKKIQAESKRVW